jgi:hypothetical protein
MGLMQCRSTFTWSQKLYLELINENIPWIVLIHNGQGNVGLGFLFYH